MTSSTFFKNGHIVLTTEFDEERNELQVTSRPEAHLVPVIEASGKMYIETLAPGGWKKTIIKNVKDFCEATDVTGEILKSVFKESK